MKGAAILFFQYGTRELDYLKSRDKILGDAIDRIGYVKRNERLRSKKKETG
jgi:hypothetical protein